MPRTTPEWATFPASRKASARLWKDLVMRQHRMRRLAWRWPSKARRQRWASGRSPGLSAQRAQQISGAFCEAVDSCRHLRHNGHEEASDPWMRRRSRDSVYTNQDARIRDGRLLLPQGTRGTLRIRLPETVTGPGPVPGPGRLMQVRRSYGVVRLVCEVADVPCPQQTVIGVDVGVNSLIAATDGTTVFLLSGRGVKTVIQWRNKTVADIQLAQSCQMQGARRWKRLQRRKHQLLDKTRHQGRDATHPATHALAEAFPGATCYVGEPFNDAAQRSGRVHAQQVRTACTRKIIQHLDDKTAGALVLNEASSSQTCPVCGERSKHRRVDRCPHCGVTGPRDAVGAVTILSLGQHGAMLPDRSLPLQGKELRHGQRHPRRSSGGHPARRSA